jgi:monoamine oxidase
VTDALSVDVAIVGAGVGGLYTGYRLLTGDFDPTGAPPASVAIFELADRVGGRLESVVLPGMQVWGELGGMRYMTSQDIVTALIEDVFKAELKHIPFPMGKPTTHRFYLRKQRFLADSWAKAQQPGKGPFLTRYELDSADLGYSPDQLFNKVVHDVLMADPKIRTQYGAKISNPHPYKYKFELSAKDWDAIKPVLRYCFPGPYQNELVNDLGFWNVIEDQVSEEGYQFLADAGGYYSNTINWNAAEALPYMVGDFSKAKVAYRTIVGGYDKVASSLKKAFLSDPRASLQLGTRLIRFDHAPASAGRRYLLTLRDEQTGAKIEALADRLVLAMPRRSLELLDQDNFLFQTGSGDPTKLARTLPATIMEPSLKILMGFAGPWWRADFGATAGESITDLPIRQCYYFGTDATDTRSLLLAGYTDMDPVRFWEPLDGEQRFVPQPVDGLSAADLQSVSSPTAPSAMVAEAMRQVRELHGRSDIPDPFVAWYRDWSDDPFGGGYHAWQPGVSVRDVMQYMRRPDPAEAVHVCGEAYSDQQGWVEGALCVAERMLQEHLGLKWPNWLDPNYYLGW